jgi:hypothetical protein
MNSFWESSSYSGLSVRQYPSLWNWWQFERRGTQDKVIICVFFLLNGSHHLISTRNDLFVLHRHSFE